MRRARIRRARDRSGCGARRRSAHARRGRAWRRAGGNGWRHWRSFASLFRTRYRRAARAAASRSNRRGDPVRWRRHRAAKGSRAMKVFYGARIFDGERLHDDCALVVKGPSIQSLIAVQDRPRGGEQVRSRRRGYQPRLRRLADQRRRRRAVQRQSDRRGHRCDRRRASARWRHRLPADGRDRRAAACSTQALAAAREAQNARPRRARNSCRGAVHRPQTEGRASRPVHPPDAGSGRRRAHRRRARALWS